MKRFNALPVFLAALALLASCAKDKTQQIDDLNATNNGNRLKIATAPVAFGNLGTVQLTRFEPTNTQTVFGYTITAGTVAVEKLDLGLQYCNTYPEILSVTGATATWAAESLLSKNATYKSAKFLKLAVKVQPGQTATVTFTLKGYWNADLRKSFLIGSNVMELRDLQSPVCDAAGTLADVEATSLTFDGSKITVTGEVISDGGSEVYERGIIYCLGKVPEPYFYPNDAVRIKDEGAGLGTFTCQFDFSNTGQPVYVVAYAINRCARCYSDGNEKISYSSVVAYPQPVINYGTLTDRGSTYRTVDIGNLTWMADNLAYLPADNWFFKTTRKGLETSGVFVYGYKGTSASEARATANYQKYGCLYNWKTAQNVCPEGWRLPTDADWNDLERTLGMTESGIASFGFKRSGEVAPKLKSTSKLDWFWNIVTTVNAGTNETGFDAVGSGQLVFYSSNTYAFTWEGQDALFWTSSLDPQSVPIARDLKYCEIAVAKLALTAERGLSVRCVKDK